MNGSLPSAVRIGAWSMLGTPAAASLMARVGADWVVLDAQHGFYDDAALVAAIPAAGSVPVRVRVAENNAALIGRSLDAGASGVIVPMVQNAAEAAAAAAACRYAPRGIRSWGPLAAYRGETPTPPEQADAAVSCAVMVETSDALADVEAIAAVAGVDEVFVGPFDLAIALGVSVTDLLADDRPGNPLDTVVAACRRAGTLPGAFAGSLDAARTLAARGFTSLAVAVDTQLLTAAGAALVTQARQSAPGRDGAT